MSDKKQYQQSRLSPELRGEAVSSLNRGSAMFEDYRTTPLPSTYVGISQQREQALGMMQEPGAAYAPAFDEWNKTVSGGYLDPTSNPYFQRIAEESAGKAVSGVQSQFAGSGMGGFSSMGGRAAMDVGASTRANLYGDIYSGERERQGKMVAMAPQMDKLQYADAARMGQVGQQYEADIAAQQAEEMRQFGYPLWLQQMEQASLAGSPLMNESDQESRTPFDWLAFAGGVASGLMPQPDSLFGGGGGGGDV